MNPLLANFPWPARPDGALPRWNGHAFDVGGAEMNPLSYPVSISGWTEHLTELHEDETAAGTHFIDVASRNGALSALRRAWDRLKKQHLADEGSPWHGKVIMEVGSSGGHLLKDLRRAFPEAAIIGSDAVPGALAQIAQRQPGQPLLQIDITRCPLPAQCLDAMVLLNVLEHIEDHDKAMAEIFRLLRPGGVVMIEVPAGSNLFDDYDRHLLHYRRYQINDLLNRLRANGFVIQESNHLGFLHYMGFVAVKRLNQRRQQRNEEARAQGVQRAIAITRALNPIGHVLMWSEAALARLVRLPYGIRCTVLAERPR